jgi:hypothetical protein
MANTSRGHGNLGVKIVYNKNPRNSVTIWCKNESERSEIIREVIADSAMVKSYERVERNHKSQGFFRR